MYPQRFASASRPPQQRRVGACTRTNEMLYGSGQQQQQSQQEDERSNDVSSNHHLALMENMRALTLRRDRQRKLFISSADRDRYKYATAAQFTLTVPDSLRFSTERVQSIALHDLVFPYAGYVINQYNDTLYMSENGNGVSTAPTLYYQQISHGTYTVNQLLDHLNEISVNWVADTTPALPTPGGFTFNSQSLQNVYTWDYDPMSLRLIFMTTNSSPVTTFIHCPPYKHTERAIGQSTRRFVSDVLVTNAYIVTGATNVLRLNTTGTKHNIVFNAMITEIRLVSRVNPGRVYTKNNIVFYSAAAYTSEVLNSYDEEWLQIEIAGLGAAWAAIFDSTDTAIEGYIRTRAASNCGWRVLGFINSNDDGYTQIPVTAVSDGNSLTRTLHKFTTSLPVYRTATQTITLPAGANWSLTPAAPQTPTLGAAAAGFMFSVAKAAFTLNSTVPSATTPWHVYSTGYFVSDQVLDLRGDSLHILIRVKINDVTVGRYRKVDNGVIFDNLNSGLGSEPFFAYFFVDTTYGANVVRFPTDDIGDFQYYLDDSTSQRITEASLTNAKRMRTADGGYAESAGVSGVNGAIQTIHKLEFELLDDRGYAIDTNGLNWQCVLSLSYVQS